jgi:hypothetical protein
MFEKKYINFYICIFSIICIIVIYIYNTNEISLIGPGKTDAPITGSILKPSGFLTEKYILYKLYLDITPIPMDSNINGYDSTIHPDTIYRIWCVKDPILECGGRKANIDHLNMSKKNTPNWRQVIYGDTEAIEFLYKYFGKNHRITILIF